MAKGERREMETLLALRAADAGASRDGRGRAIPLSEIRGQASLLRAGATVGSFTAVGRVFGYARDVAVAAVLGAGPVADAFFLALRVPSFVRQLFAGRGVGAVFIPMFTRRLARSGENPARVFAGELVAFAAAAVTALTVLLELAAPWFVYLLAPGFAGADGQAQLTVVLVRKVVATAVASAIMAGALWLAGLALGGDPDAGGFERIAGLAAMVAVGLGSFALAARATGAVRWRERKPPAGGGK